MRNSSPPIVTLFLSVLSTSRVGSEEEVEGEGGEDIQVGEGDDDEDYEKEDPPPSDINDCDWTTLQYNIHDTIN